MASSHEFLINNQNPENKVSNIKTLNAICNGLNIGVGPCDFEICKNAITYKIIVNA